MFGPKAFMFGPVPRLFEEPTVHIEVTPPEPETDPEETIDEITDVSEQLALHSIISDERHTEILERLTECQNQLQQLSTAENPVTAQVNRDLLELKNELQSLKLSLDTMLKNLTPSQSEPVIVVEEPPVLPNPAGLTEEPRPEEPLPEPTAENQPPKRKSRFI